MNVNELTAVVLADTSTESRLHLSFPFLLSDTRSFCGTMHRQRPGAVEVPTLTQRVHLQLLPQADLLQAVVEVGLRGAGRRKGEDAHDLPLVSARCTGDGEGNDGVIKISTTNNITARNNIRLD